MALQSELGGCNLLGRAHRCRRWSDEYAENCGSNRGGLPHARNHQGVSHERCRSSRAEAEVLQGLTEGEVVILHPSNQLKDGVRVRTQ